MSSWAQQNPRVAGVGVICLAVILAGINFAAMYFMDSWYPSIFPVAGLAGCYGVVQIITGHSPRNWGDAPPLWWILAAIATVCGIGLGLAANWFIFGELI